MVIEAFGVFCRLGKCLYCLFGFVYDFWGVFCHDLLKKWQLYLGVYIYRGIWGLKFIQYFLLVRLSDGLTTMYTSSCGPEGYNMLTTFKQAYE